jgi:hypothetical protein
MRKAIIGSFAILAIAALALASSDPWKDKPFQQWDEKDVQKVLSNSPWSRMTQADAGFDGSASAPSSGLPQGSSAGAGAPGGGGGGGRGSMGGGGGSSPSGPAGTGDQTGGGVPQLTFAIRWYSSRTVREAMLRSSVLAGSLKEDEAEKQLAQPTEDYQVLVSGPQMSAFESAEEAGVKARTTLVTKKGKLKIEPSKVDFQRSTDGKTIRAILISFPKRTATGEATIGAEEKGADFSCTPGKVAIKASFDFSKMYDAQGRDL